MGCRGESSTRRVRCRDTCEVGKISGHDESLESLLSGEAIREELRDTNSNLEEKVAQKEFRKDLYFRINVVNIFMPPLRTMGEVAAEATGAEGAAGAAHLFPVKDPWAYIPARPMGAVSVRRAIPPCAGRRASGRGRRPSGTARR